MTHTQLQTKHTLLHYLNLIVTLLNFVKTGSNSAGVHWKISTIAFTLIASLGLVKSAHADYFSYENTSSEVITDNSCSTSNYLTKTFNVTDSFTVADVNLGFVADHSMRGDIRLRLTSPNGTTVTLINESSTTRWNYDIWLNDNSSVPVNTGFNDSDNDSTITPYVYEHSVSPNGPFSAFIGEPSSGTWTISMCDSTAGDTGVFQRAKLNLFDGNAGSGTAPGAMSCGANAKSFNWGSHNLTSGSLNQTFNNVDGSGVDVSWIASGRTDLLINNTPDDLTIFSSGGGIGGGGESYVLIADPSDTSTTSPVTGTVNFTQPVSDLRFSIYDLDSSNPSSSAEGRVDKVTITGTDGTNIYTPTLVAVNSNPSFEINANVATAPIAFDSQSNNDTRGTVDVYFSEPVTSISVIYEEGGNAPNPYGRGAAISSMLFCAGKDYGDAPTTGVSPNGMATNNYGEASHGLSIGTYMGSADPDFDLSNQASANADGDDADGNDDEDGVFTDAALSNSLQGSSFGLESSTTLHIPVSGSGNLSAWFDWNGDGDFDDLGEQVADAVAGNNETMTLVVNVPLNAYPGNTFARFRFSPDAVANAPTGLAIGGEVEDYQITIANIPTTPTTSAKNYCSGTWASNGTGGYVTTTAQGVQITATVTSGASSNWSFSPNDALNASGVFSDANFNGTPSLSSVFYWDTTPEDGRTANASDDAQTGTLTFTFNTTTRNPVIHFDRLGGYGGSSSASPQILSNSALITPNTAGMAFNKLAGTSHFEVTAGTIQRTPNETLVWGESSSQSNPDSTRYTAMGSVEITGSFNSLSLNLTGAGVEGAGADGIEFVVCAPPYDYGDAPGSYQDAAHLIPDTGSTVYLGNLKPDFESVSLHAANGGSDGLGDDQTGDHDEGGVTLRGQSLNDQTLAISETVTLVADTNGSGTLYGWIDWNRDGSFGAGEEITGGGMASTGGNVSITVTPPATMIAGVSYARFRYSSDTAAASPFGDASDGEVEDYRITLGNQYSLSGRVFKDSNVDGVNDTGESGVSGLPMVLTGSTTGGDPICVSSLTDASGDYLFFPVEPGTYSVYEASREAVPTPTSCDINNARDPEGYRSTTDNAITSINVTNANVSNINFGDVQLPTFSPDNSGTILPGNVVFYAHTFTPTSTGQLSFSSVNSGAVTTGWNNVLYQDSNCNGVLDGSEGAAAITGNLATTAGSNICLINKVYAPTNVANGETLNTAITADFSYTDGAGTPNAIAGTVTLDVVDVSKSAVNDPLIGSSRLELKKTVRNITQSTAETETQNQANPNDILEYKIYYSNSGNGPITDLKVNDTAQEFTLLQTGSALCDSTPTNLNCSPQENDPEVEWLFTGTLEGGAEGAVSYRVQVE